MNLPEPEWFTIGALARRWGKDEDYIEQLIEDGKIQVKVKEGSGCFSSDPNEMREWERCKRLVPRPWSPPLQGWCIGSKIVIPLSEVKRIEKTVGLPRPDIKKYVEEQRAKNVSNDKMVYELREMGFTNNEIGVALNLGIYREDSNALAVRVSRLYKKNKKC